MPEQYKKAESGHFIALFAQCTALFPAQQAVKSEHDQGDAQELSLIEADGLNHGEFPRFLHLLEHLYKETESEDARQAPAEVKTCAHLLLPAAVKGQRQQEEDEILDQLNGEAFRQLLFYHM